MPPRLRFLLLIGILLVAGCTSTVIEAQPVRPQSQANPQVDLRDLERRILGAINDRRRLDGQHVLWPDTSLAALARTHSRDMRDREFVAHRNPDGLRAGERARQAGYVYRELGENLFQGRLYDTIAHTRRGTEEQTFYLWYAPDELADLVATMWMESPSHRENMLAGRYDYGGVGIAIGSDYNVFVTLNLSAR